jgi:hypothetical protein
MRRSVISILLFVVLGSLLLLFFIFNNTDRKHFQWFPNYKGDSDQPYGTLLIRKMLTSYRPGARFIYNEKKSLNALLKDERNTPTDYVFIGQSIHLDAQDTDALLNFIAQGNDAFIASLDPPTDILYRFYSDECNGSIEYGSQEGKTMNFNFYHDTLHTAYGYNYTYRRGSDDISTTWNTFSSALFCDSTKLITPLGYLNPFHPNFIRISHGKGNFYLHSNPILFTNYFLVKTTAVDYSSSVFSHLGGKNIIWDEYSKVPFFGDNNRENSPLYYILQQPSLKYAWWLLLLAVLLYVVFAAKRTQRVIPVLEVKSNTSLAYIKMIASLHFQNGNHMDMVRKKMRYFMYFIRSKYGIHAQTFTEEHVSKLAEKSKVDIADVRAVFDINSRIERNSYYNVQSWGLIELYQAIDNFYKKCK